MFPAFPIGIQSQSGAILAKIVDFKALKKEVGSIFKEVPLSTKGKFG